ncbi:MULTISPECIES: hypothetical protein [unclassified Clostridium]|uniref:hypothetical protein n=1 Tax=unclassified Clostridium TaxID=2614128 RepID=UPI0002973A08|nr:MULTISPECIES: hypothetical protein [unclassified Clostridium]EKQ52286.1 MAG: hypothetical protein A370_04448 [Clostridium sp. Maddingley MBC34-26]
MNKKCEKCKYTLITCEQLCFWLGFIEAGQISPDYKEEYRSLVGAVKLYMNIKNKYMKHNLDDCNEKCFSCDNRLRVEKSEKYFEKILEIIKNNFYSREKKLAKIYRLHEKYIEECGSFSDKELFKK